MKQIFFTLIRVLITLAIILFIFSKIDFAGTWQIMAGSNLIFLLISFLSFFVFTFTVALRWQIILNLYKFPVSILRAFYIYMIAFFFNNFLPSTVGMDVVRGAYVPGRENRLPDVISSIIIERWIGLLGIIIYISVVPIIFFKEIDLKYFLPVSAAGITASVIFFISIVSEKVFSFFSFLFSKIKVLGLGVKINSLYNSLRIIKDHKKLFISNLALSILIQLIIVFINYFIVLSQGLSIELKPLIIYIPLISIISMIPLTINGLGLREMAYIAFFGIALKEEALSLSLSYFIISVAFSLIGGIFFIFDRKEIKENV